MRRTKHLLQSSILVILFFGLGKLTGLVRTRLVSVTFGTGTAFDAFTAANQLPEVFFIVIAGGSLAAAFIPVYSAYLHDKGQQAAMKLANTVLTLVIVILGLLSATGALFAPWLTRTILVPNFDPATQALTAVIMRVILIQTTIFGISGVLSSVLNAHQHFALPALAPIALDIGYWLGLVFLVPSQGILGLAWGTVIGAVLHVAIQLPALLRYRYRYWPTLNLRLEGMGEIMRLMGPRIVTLGVIQLSDLYIVRLASALPPGSTSGYFYGFALMQLPETLFGTAIALVVFPTLAELFNEGDMAGLKQTAVNTLSIIWTLTIPCAAGLVLLGQPAISFLLEGGNFTAQSTRLVYSILVVFSVRIVSEATLEVVARLFYARHNTRIPMFAYLGWLAVTVFLAYLFVDDWGVAGLALATTVAFTLLSAVLFWLNHRALGDLWNRRLGLSAVRAILATAGMSLVIVAISQFVTSPLLFLAAGTASGILSYLLLNLLLGGQEIRYLITLLRWS
ncbi:MAG: murein biosynthesis integral membrane protein MurJ [Ardenticatenaceae bacterium]|nr:murein biosynthesis integral membrane protein MurJ [Ardenticatenaceae bacterium]